MMNMCLNHPQNITNTSLKQYSYTVYGIHIQIYIKSFYRFLLYLSGLMSSFYISYVCATVPFHLYVCMYVCIYIYIYIYEDYDVVV